MEIAAPGTLWNLLPSSGVTGTYNCHAEIPVCVWKMPSQVPKLVPQVLCQTSRLFSPYKLGLILRVFEGQILIIFA